MLVDTPSQELSNRVNVGDSGGVVLAGRMSCPSCGERLQWGASSRRAPWVIVPHMMLSIVAHMMLSIVASQRHLLHQLVNTLDAHLLA